MNDGNIGGITITPKSNTPTFNGTDLKTLRKGADITQTRAAEVLGISRGYYSNIENGFRKPNLEVAPLVDVFGKTLAAGVSEY